MKSTSFYNLTFTLYFIFIFNILNAQKLSYSAQFGYQFGYGNQTTESIVISSDGSFTQYHYANERSKLSSGFLSGLGVNYRYSPSISINFHLFYFKGASTTSSFVEMYPDYINFYGNTYRINAGYSNPSVSFHLPKGPFQFQLSIGPILGYSKKFDNIKNDLLSKSGFTYQETEFETQASMLKGFKSSFGVAGKLSSKVNWFGEFSVLNWSFSPKKMQMVAHTINGVDELASLSDYEKETIYVDQYTYSGNTDPNKPRELLRRAIQINGVSLQVGFNYSF